MEKRLLNHRSHSIRLSQDHSPWRKPDPSGRPRQWVRGIALFMVIVLMALGGCSPHPDLVAQQFVEALNDHNLDGAMRLFAWDAVVDTGSSLPFSGQDNIERWLQGLFADNLNLRMGNPQVEDNQITVDLTVTTDSARDLGLDSLAGTGILKVQLGRITALNFTLSQESQAELLQAKLAVGSPILTYAVTPDPAPLQVSQGQETHLASLTILITNGTKQDIEVNRITFILPQAGEDASQLTTNPGRIHTDSPSNGWGLHRNNAAGVGPGFWLAPVPPDDGLLAAGKGLSFTMFNILVNEQPGVFELEIIEEITQEPGETTQSSTTIQLDKVLPQFFVSELTARPPIIDPGETTKLTWSGSYSATYAITYGDRTEEIRPGEDEYPVTNLQETTTFYLEVNARVGEDAVTVQRQRTVTVRSVEILNFIADPNTVTMGDTLNLSWKTQFAARCELWEGVVLLDPDAPCTAKAYAVRPLTTNPTLYTLKAFSKGDRQTVQQTCNVAVTGLEPKIIATVPVGEKPYKVGVNADGTRLYVANQNSIAILDLEKVENDPQSATLATIDLGDRYTDDVAFDLHTGKTFITWHQGDGVGRSLSVIDTALAESDPQNAIIEPVNMGEVTRGRYYLVLSPDGIRLYVGNQYSTDIAVIDTQKAVSDPEHALVGTIPMKTPPTAMAVNPDSTRLYVVDERAHITAIIDVRMAEINAQNATLARFSSGDPTFDTFAFSPDGSRIYTTFMMGGKFLPSLTVKDTQVAEIPTENAIVGWVNFNRTADAPSILVLDPDGRSLYLTNRDSHSILVFDTAMLETDPDNALETTISLQNSPSAMAISPDGHRLYVADWDSNSVSVIAIPQE